VNSKRGEIIVREDGRTWRLQWRGFTSRRNLHRHLLKHVVRLFDDVISEHDPERWEELWPSPTLEKRPSTRRKNTLDRLRQASPPCPMATTRPNEQSCQNCTDDTHAFNAADRKLEPRLKEYLQVVERELFSALRWDFGQGKTFLFQKPPGKMLPQLCTFSPERVVVVSAMGPKDFRTITAYRMSLHNRKGEKIPLRCAYSDFLGKRRSAKLGGTLLDWKVEVRDRGE